MDLDLAGKVALVTGSSRGIGGAIALALHREGAAVALNARTGSALETMAALLGAPCSAHVADVMQPAECRALVDAVVARWGKIDVVVCNVGSGASVPPGEESAEEWRRVMDVNLYSATNMIEAARAALSQSRGVAICISSICGVETLGAPVTYSTAKAALNAYVRGIARPLGAKGVRVLGVAPGNVLFDGGTWDKKLAQDREGVERMLDSQVSLKRLGTPAEVADLVAFLASPRASFITGTIVVADGGQIRS